MKFIKRVLLLISVLAVLAGTVYTLDWLGVIDAKPTIAKLMGEKPAKVAVPVKKPATTAATSANDKLQKEISQLKTQIQTLQKQLTTTKSEKDALTQKQQKMEQDLLNKVATEEEAVSKETSYQQLAKYYAEMKPKDAVAILDNLDEETVIGILINLESEQTAKILTAMDAKKAAKLVNKLSL